ncbi:MAG: phospholipase D family protein [Gammaproteobacteria bacterium]|nr:phospholipase D family protein [Gammaproteobacteria bacterium]
MRRSTFRFLTPFLPIIFIIAGCATVPLDVPKQSSVAVEDNSHTEFGELAVGWTELHDGKSGFFPFAYGLDALGARLEMAENAEASIDLQYFLMKDDAAGAIISDALWRAAERGVRIRFLLDDVFTTAADSGLLALSAHPNIEVRLFNPISRRGLHALNFIGHFRRANRRMHNKSFTVDNAISIVGGRNIADEYFQLKTDAVFSDFDVLAFGSIVKQVSTSFDSYWNHSLAIPIEQFIKAEHSNSAGSPGFRDDAETAKTRNDIIARATGQKLIRQLSSGETKLFAASARVLADNPDKLQNAVSAENMTLATELAEVLARSEHELIFVSPYYVPEDQGVEFVRGVVDKGVRVVVVTNSLASTNHIPVHSAYSGYRREVLDAGVELFEIRANAGRVAQGGDGPTQLTLHTKLIVIDRRYLFVGSLNLDPRSIEINAEMGLLIDSPDLAERIATGLEKNLPDSAYRVVKNDRGTLEWHTTIDGRAVVEKTEPLSSRWRRFKATILRIIPDGQL